MPRRRVTRRSSRMAEPPADETEDLPAENDDDDSDGTSPPPPANNDEEEEDMKEAAPLRRVGGRRSSAKQAVPAKASSRKRKAKLQEDAETSTPAATEDDEPQRKRRSKRDRDASVKPKRPTRGQKKATQAPPEGDETEENKSDASPSESEQPDEDSQSEQKSKRSTRGKQQKKTSKPQKEEEGDDPEEKQSDDSPSGSDKPDDDSQPDDADEKGTPKKKTPATRGTKRTRATRKVKAADAQSGDSGSEEPDANESDASKEVVPKKVVKELPKRRKGSKRQQQAKEPLSADEGDNQDEGTRRKSSRVASTKTKSAKSSQSQKATQETNPSDVSDSDTEQQGEEEDSQSVTPNKAKASNRPLRGRRANPPPKDDEPLDTDASSDSEIQDDNDSKGKDMDSLGRRGKKKGARYRRKTAHAKGGGDSSEVDSSRELEDDNQSSESNEDSDAGMQPTRRKKSLNANQEDESKPGSRNDSSGSKRSGRRARRGGRDKTPQDKGTKAASDDESEDSASLSDSQNDDVGPSGNSEDDSKRNETTRKSRRRSNPPQEDKVDQSAPQTPSGSSALATEMGDGAISEKAKATTLSEDLEVDALQERENAEEDKADRADDATSASGMTHKQAQASKGEGKHEERIESDKPLLGSGDAIKDDNIGAERPAEEVKAAPASSTGSQFDTVQGLEIDAELSLKKREDNGSKADFENLEKGEGNGGTKEMAVPRQPVVSQKQVLSANEEVTEKVQRGPTIDDGGMLALLVNVAVEQSRDELHKGPPGVGQIEEPTANQGIDAVPSTGAKDASQKIGSSGDGNTSEKSTAAKEIGASLPIVPQSVSTKEEVLILAKQDPVEKDDTCQESRSETMQTEASPTRPSDRDLKTNLEVKHNEVDAPKGSPKTSIHPREGKASLGAPSLDEVSGERSIRDSLAAGKDSGERSGTDEAHTSLNDTVLSVHSAGVVVNDTATRRAEGEQNAGSTGGSATQLNEAASSLGVFSNAVDLVTFPNDERDRGTSGHGESKEANHIKVDAPARANDDIKTGVQQSIGTTKVADTVDAKRTVELGESATTQNEESKSVLLEESRTDKIREPSELSKVVVSRPATESEGLAGQTKSEEDDLPSRSCDGMAKSDVQGDVEESTGTGSVDATVSSVSEPRCALGETVEKNGISASPEGIPDESNAAVRKLDTTIESDRGGIDGKGTAQPLSERPSQRGKDEQAARMTGVDEPKAQESVVNESQGLMHTAVLERERTDSEGAGEKYVPPAQEVLMDPKLSSLEFSPKDAAEHSRNGATLHEAADKGQAVNPEAMKESPSIYASENADPIQETAVVEDSMLAQTSSVEVTREPIDPLGANARKHHLMDEAQDSAKRIKLTVDEPQESESEAEDIVTEPPISRCPKHRLESIKAQMLKEARHAHGERGAARLFAEYWKYFVLRLEKGGAEEKSKPTAAIKNFLKTKKLRRLHNKLVLGILKRCLTPTHPSREVQSHIPQGCRSKIRAAVQRGRRSSPSSAAATGQTWVYSLAVAQPPIVSFESPPLQSMALQGLMPVRTELRIPGALAIDPIIRSVTSRQSMKAADHAVWLVVVGAREYANMLIKACIEAKKAAAEEKIVRTLRPRALHVSARLKPFDFTIKSKAPGGGHITAFDLYTLTSQLPMGAVRSLGGSVSRLSFEAAQMNSLDTRSSVVEGGFEVLKNFVLSKLTSSIAAASSRSLAQQNASTKGHAAEAAPKAISKPVPRIASKATRKISQEESKSGGGLGKGAKGLASLRERSSFSKKEDALSTVEKNTSATAQENKGEGTVPTEVKQESGPDADKVEESNMDEDNSDSNSAGRRGKGSGVKNLAAMLKRNRPSTEEGSSEGKD